MAAVSQCRSMRLGGQAATRDRAMGPASRGVASRAPLSLRASLFGSRVLSARAALVPAPLPAARRRGGQSSRPSRGCAGRARGGADSNWRDPSAPFTTETSLYPPFAPSPLYSALVTRMCGIIGIYRREGDVSLELYEGLLMLQHRGQARGGGVGRERGGKAPHPPLFPPSPADPPLALKRHLQAFRRRPLQAHSPSPRLFGAPRLASCAAPPLARIVAV